MFCKYNFSIENNNLYGIIKTEIKAVNYVVNNLVSVIIPMYNVQNFAAECIESIIKQTYTNIEVILVNDGSTDSTLEICKAYAEKDSRVRVIDKENGGPTSCRVAGKNEANGEYIFFSDSDDILKPELIEKLLKACLENNAEVSACGYEKFGGENAEFRIKSDKAVIEKNDFESAIILPSISPDAADKTQIALFYWNHLYKAECLTDDCFISDKICTREDVYTNLKILNNINRIAVVDEVLYRYRMNMNSITVAYREGKLEKDLYFINFIKSFLQKHGIECQDRLNKMIYGAAYGCIDNFCKKGSYEVFKNGIKKMKAESEINDAIKASLNGSISKAQKIAGELYTKNAVLALYNFRKLILKSKGIG